MTHLLSRLCLPHLRTHLPCRLWTLKILGLSSDVSACAVPVRQASVLPWASFPRTPRDVAVALRLDLPSARRSTDLHARFYCSCSLSSRCALPGAPKKGSATEVALPRGEARSTPRWSLIKTPQFVIVAMANTGDPAL